MAQLSEEEFLEITNSHNPKKFSSMIEAIVSRDGIRYMDAIFDYCLESNIDVDIVPKLLTASLRDKIQVEAMNYNFFPKVGQLPV